MEDIKVYLRKKKKKSNNEVVNNTKIFQKMKKICWLSIEKNDKMTLIVIIREYFFIKKILSSYKSKYKKLILLSLFLKSSSIRQNLQSSLVMRNFLFYA